MKNETNLENLNNTFKQIAEEDDKVVFIGEDIALPYEGAFKVEKSLQKMFTDRVISTPISEESFTGLAAGMAVRGYKPVVDMMFSDFMTFSFDILLNFVSKYPEMYGERKKINMILRSANGGYRGYGPTHSQSMQKFFMGIPNLCVYEMSPFHDNKDVIRNMFKEEEPCVFLEEKMIYTKRIYRNGEVNDVFSFKYLGSDNEYAYAYIDEMEPDAYIICPGGMTEICLEAAEKLMIDEEISVGIIVPSKLYPFKIEAIKDIVLSGKNIFVAEESTRGADWGSVVLREVCEINNDKAPVWVKFLSSEDSVIPASFYLENKMLLSVDKIVKAISSSIGGSNE